MKTAGSRLPRGTKTRICSFLISMAPKQVDFKSKLTKTFVGTAVGLADTRLNTTTQHTRASGLILKDVEVVSVVFFAYKNVLAAQRLLISTFSGV